MTVQIIKNTKTLLKNIEAFKDKGRTLQIEAHTLAVSVLHHLGTHKDMRVANNFLVAFIEAMPEMARVNALKQWFETFGNVRFEDNVAVYDATKTVKMGEAIEKPFWKLKANEGVPYTPIDVMAKFNQFIQTLERDAKKTGRDHGKDIAALKALRDSRPAPVDAIQTIDPIMPLAASSDPLAGYSPAH